MTASIVKKARFTLIELLVVIGIIGILAAIILPAVAGVRHQSKLLEAKTKATLIASAVESYTSTYNSLPIAETGNDSIDIEVDATLLNILNGNNPRNKMFFANNGTVLNPWEGTFSISLDGDHDNQVSADGNTVTGNVAVYTKYKNDVVYSWEE